MEQRSNVKSAVNSILHLAQQHPTSPAQRCESSPASLSQRQIGLVGVEEHAIKEFAVGSLVVDGESAIADWLGGDDSDDMSWFDAGDGSVPFDVFALQHRLVATTFP